MAIKSIRTLNFKDQDIQRFQDDVQLTVGELQKLSFLDGIRIEATVGTSPTTIQHKLQYTPVGFFIMDKQGLGDVYRVSWDAENIVLRSSVSVKIVLWVF